MWTIARFDFNCIASGCLDMCPYPCPFSCSCCCDCHSLLPTSSASDSGLRRVVGQKNKKLNLSCVLDLLPVLTQKIYLGDLLYSSLSGGQANLLRQLKLSHKYRKIFPHFYVTNYVKIFNELLSKPSQGGLLVTYYC